MDIIIGDKHIKYLFNMSKNVPISKRELHPAAFYFPVEI